MGRIHSSGRIASRGLDVDLEWTVVGNSIADVSENELEIWYSAAGPVDRASEAAGLGRIGSRSSRANSSRTGGCRTARCCRSITSSTIQTNGGNYIAIYLSPHLRSGRRRAASPRACGWFASTGDEVRDGRFHCWIERDDPLELDRRGQLRAFRFPSFFSERSNVDSHQINSLACGFRVIGVANLDATHQKMNVTSSQGPTRDDRLKPDIAAPGTDIVAAAASAGAKRNGSSMTGTSMASPYVAGVVGLMLAVNPKLTSAQCQGILQRTCQPLPGASYEWKNDAGFGQIDPQAAIEEAKTFDQRIRLDVRRPP